VASESRAAEYAGGGGVARLDLGGIVVETLVEQQGPVFPVREFFPGLPEEQLAEHRADLRRAGALDEADRLVLAVLSYVIRTREQVVLVDTCVGNDRPLPRVPVWDRRRSPAFADGLARLGLAPDDVDVVVNTHLHADHVGWNTHLVAGRWQPMFPRARYCFVEPELRHWQRVHAAAPLPVMTDSVLPVIGAGQADVVPPDAVLAPGVRLEPTPGHTPGHVVVRVEGPRGRAAITGDLIHSPLQLVLPGLCMSLEDDRERTVASRLRFLTSAAEERVVVCTGHFPMPAMGTVEQWSGGFRFRPLPTGSLPTG
jgi:glyoxylase-like metal-dependent hydrolase (beta-lactamase superfamily II)